MKNVVLLGFFGVLLLSGCHNYGGGIRVGGHYSHGYTAPPAHAPAHGRSNHRYHYYPNAEFYFDVTRNTYFYLDSRGDWTFSVNLPTRFHSHLQSGYVEVEMAEERPYLRHKHYKRKYSRHGKYKRKFNRNNRKRNSLKYNSDRERRYSDDHKNNYRKKRHDRGLKYSDDYKSQPRKNKHDRGLRFTDDDNKKTRKYSDDRDKKKRKYSDDRDKKKRKYSDDNKKKYKKKKQKDYEDEEKNGKGMRFK